jgi:hypothetical protein
VIFALLVVASEARDYGKDEVVTYYSVDMDWPELTANRLENTHSPLYFWLLKPYADAVGDPIALRYPSALFAAISVGVLTGVMAFSCSAAAAILLGIGFLSSPALVELGHVARPYALLMAFTAIGLACSVLVLQSNSVANQSQNAGRTRRSWLPLQVSLIGAAGTMMAGGLSALAISLTPYLSNKVRADRRFTRDWLRKMIPVFVACALVVLILSPYLWMRAGNYWADRIPFSLETFERIFRTAFTYKFAITELRLRSLIHGIVLVSSVILFLIGIAKRNQFLSMYLPAVTLAIGLPLALIALSLHTGLLVARYFYLAVPAVLCVMALGASVVSRNRFGLVALIIVAPLFVSQGIVAALSRGSASISDLETASKTIARFADVRDEIISSPPSRRRYLNFFLHHWGESSSRFRLSGGPRNEEELRRQIELLLQDRRAVWLVAERKYGEVNLNKIVSEQIQVCRLEAEPVLMAVFYLAGTPLPEGMACR